MRFSSLIVALPLCLAPLAGCQFEHNPEDAPAAQDTAKVEQGADTMAARDLAPGEAADTVSRYLIERAEQYQPVVEMPTGIDVEIVFLDGVYVRNSQ